MQSYQSPYEVIIPMILGLIGAILTFVLSFKKQSGTLGKRGLFATAMLGIYILFAQALFHYNGQIKQLFIPMLGFTALAIIEIFNRENK